MPLARQLAGQRHPTDTPARPRMPRRHEYLDRPSPRGHVCPAHVSPNCVPTAVVRAVTRDNQIVRLRSDPHVARHPPGTGGGASRPNHVDPGTGGKVDPGLAAVDRHPQGVRERCDPVDPAGLDRGPAGGGRSETSPSIFTSGERTILGHSRKRAPRRNTTVGMPALHDRRNGRSMDASDRGGHLL